jgi:hypothetical protein
LLALLGGATVVVVSRLRLKIRYDYMDRIHVSQDNSQEAGFVKTECAFFPHFGLNTAPRRKRKICCGRLHRNMQSMCVGPCKMWQKQEQTSA